jgi:RimJ/RimL family protein N-acetyltransferase
MLAIEMFYPDDAIVPQELRSDEFLIRPLRTTDLKLDYEALMSSKALLRQWSQSDWPSDNFSLEDDLIDLQRHEQEHLKRQSFTFTIFNLDESECLGCIYIYPPSPVLRQHNYEALVAFWVRQSRLSDALDQRILKALLDWFKQEWAFTRIFFETNYKMPRQIELLTQAGLQQRHTTHHIFYS